MPPSILLCALEPDRWDLTNRLPRPWPPAGFGQWEALARDGGKQETKVKMFVPLLSLRAASLQEGPGSCQWPTTTLSGSW